jgi:endoglucanase
MNKNFLGSLLSAPSPSGFEEEATKVYDNYMSEFAKHEFTDNMGNSVYSLADISKPTKKRIMISGHIDSIGLMVSNITEDGLLNIASNGGIDKKTLPGSVVIVLSEVGPKKGIIGKKPIHVETSEERDKVDSLKDLTVDVGGDLEGIHVGTLIIFERNYDLEFGKDKKYIIGPDLDDKIGVYITSQVLEKAGAIPGVLLYGVSMVQEEVGLRGAAAVSKSINPDISIDIDVTFETHQSGLSKSEYGDIKLGSGPVIEWGADKSRSLNNELLEISKKHNIPIQHEATRPGGTNTDAIQIMSKDCITTHIAIPLKNMHTQVEMISWDDVNNCIDLIVELLRNHKY